MNEDLVRKINETVDPYDNLYILGDLMLGQPENIEYIKRLNGYLHIVLGNHDTKTRENLYSQLPNVVEIADVGIKLDYKKYHFALTHYPMLTGNIEKESLKQMTCNLFAHTHQTEEFYEDKAYMFHCGVDSHNGYPVLLDDIIQKMNIKVRCAVPASPTVETSTAAPAKSRCRKCLYAWPFCGKSDKNGDCSKYKKDPPDGGYY